MILPRARHLVAPVLFALTTMVVFASAAHADGLPTPGMGDLLPSPPVPAGGGRTLYETYGNPLLWQLDSDYGVGDIIDPAIEVVADVCMALTAVIGSAAVVVTDWAIQAVTVPAVEHAITRAISGASAGLTTTLLPAALVGGAVVAFARHRADNGAASQIAWVLASAVLSISLLTGAAGWVSAIDTVRQAGAEVTTRATTAGLAAEGGGGDGMPFVVPHAVSYGGGSPQAEMLREGSDAVWRTYVATPWCAAEFGSLEGCRRYGRELLDQGVNPEARKVWLENHVTHDAVGSDTVTWRQGHVPLGRVVIAMFALGAVLLYAVLAVMLAYGSLAGLLGALMLLVTGPLFACLWVIPGRPRAWGNRWFDFVLGFTLQSFASTLVLSCVLITTTAAVDMVGVYGWFAGASLSLTAGLVAFKVRSLIWQILGVPGTVAAGTALTGVALAAVRAFRRSPGVSRSGGSAGRTPPRRPTVGDNGGGNPGGSGAGHPVPPAGSAGPAGIGARRPLPPAPSGHAAVPGARTSPEDSGAPGPSPLTSSPPSPAASPAPTAPTAPTTPATPARPPAVPTAGAAPGSPVLRNGEAGTPFAFRQATSAGQRQPRVVRAEGRPVGQAPVSTGPRPARAGTHHRSARSTARPPVPPVRTRGNR